MQAMHGRLSDPASYQALQHFVTHSPWEAESVWTRLRAVVPPRTGILAVDDTGLPKQGRHSVGVQRQYCGALGKIGNCQVAVSTVLVGDRLAWPLSFELYLPQTWAADDERRTRAGIPERVRFREKWRIALSHVRRVLKAGFTITAVVADADYGSTAAFRRGLAQLGLRYGVAIRGSVTVWIGGASRALPVNEVVTAVPEAAWERVEWATGTKGPLAARFVAYRVRPAKSRGDTVVAVRARAGHRRAEVLPAQPRRDGDAARPGPHRAEPLAHRTTVPRTERRTRLRSLRRTELSGLDASCGPHRHGVHVSPTRTPAGRRGCASDVANRPLLGAGDHGGALYRQYPQRAESNRQFPAESPAANVTK